MTRTSHDGPDQQVEVVVGVVGRAHGIRGDVAIAVRTDEPERRFVPGARLRVEGSTRVLTVESVRDHSGRLLVCFEELPDRTAAESARTSTATTCSCCRPPAGAAGVSADRRTWPCAKTCR